MKEHKKLVLIEKFQKGLKNLKNNNFFESEKYFKDIIKVDPNEMDSIFYLGIISFKKKEYNECIEYLRKVINKNSNHRQSNLFIGLSHYKIKEYYKAKFYFEKIYKIDDKDLQAIINLSLSLIELKDYEKASKILKQAIKLNPKNFEICNCLGDLYLKKGNTDEAIKFYSQSIKLNSNNAIIYSNLATAYLRKSDFISAKDNFQKALKTDPNNSIVLNAYSYYLLSNIEIEKGLDAYENRKLAKKYNLKYKKDGIEWEGENLDNKTILILTEQGIGDIIQFGRYLYSLKEKYLVKIILRVKKNLINLFDGDKFTIIDEEEQIPNYDYFQYLLSLPKVFYKSENKFIDNINFIKINAKLTAHWGNKLSNLKGPKIGINWQGNPEHPKDFMRSIPLSCFEKIFHNSNLNFISLQKGFGINQISNFKYKNKLIDFSNETSDSFDDTIAVMKNLDLIITIDTSIAHLAATMEMNTWLLLDFSPDWRWHVNSKIFSWYKNLKIFNQKKIYDWDNVINDINQQLKALYG